MTLFALYLLTIVISIIIAHFHHKSDEKAMPLVSYTLIIVPLFNIILWFSIYTEHINWEKLKYDQKIKNLILTGKWITDESN